MTVNFQWVWWGWNIPQDVRLMVQYEFMRNLFLTGLIISVLAGVVSYLVVLRRSSFASHALGHIGFSGAAGAVLFSSNPVFIFYGLLIATTSSATGISLLGQKASHRDVEIGTILAFMLGLGLLFLSFYNGYSSEAYSILFGQVGGINDAQVWLIFFTAVVVLGVLGIFYRHLLFSSLDEEVSEARGMPNLLLGLIFMLALAAAISTAVTVIGVLLIFALTVTPGAIALRLVNRPLHAVLVAIGVALFATWVGTFIAYYELEPTSFFIVTIVFIIYIAVRLIPAVSRLRRWVSRAADRPSRAPMAVGPADPPTVPPLPAHSDRNRDLSRDGDS